MKMVSRRTRNPPKNPNRRTLTLKERIHVIRMYERTSNSRAIAMMYNCSLTQIKNIIRRRDEYLQEFMNNGTLGRIKRRQSARFLTVGIIVCEWLYRMRRNGDDVNDDLIICIGKQITEKLNLPEVHPNNNWLERMRVKFKMSEEELREICYIGNGDFRESIDLDDIIQDLQNFSPSEEEEKDMTTTTSAATLAFPYELARQYLKDSDKDESTDIAKIRMRNCLEEAKIDKCIMKVDGVQQTSSIRQSNEYEEPDISEFLFNHVAVKTEINEEDYSMEGSNQSTVVEEEEEEEGFVEGVKGITADSNRITAALINENQDIFPLSFSNGDSGGDGGGGVDGFCNIKAEVRAKGIGNYQEAYNILNFMEHFAITEDDSMAMNLINKLENHFREKLLNNRK